MKFHQFWLIYGEINIAFFEDGKISEGINNLFLSINFYKVTKGRLSYQLYIECFSKLSFDSELYKKSAAVADFESKESCEKHSTQR